MQIYSQAFWGLIKVRLPVLKSKNTVDPRNIPRLAASTGAPGPYPSVHLYSVVNMSLKKFLLSPIMVQTNSHKMLSTLGWPMCLLLWSVGEAA